MNSGLVKSIAADLNDWTWVAVEYRVWVIILATAIGLALPLLSASRRDMPRPAPSLVIRSGAVGLGLSSALMAVCSLLHFSDQRWLPVSQRGIVHVSAPGGVFGFTKPAVGVINSVANLITPGWCPFRTVKAFLLLPRVSRKSLPEFISSFFSVHKLSTKPGRLSARSGGYQPAYAQLIHRLLGISWRALAGHCLM